MVMKDTHYLALFLAGALALGCVTTTTSSTTFEASPAPTVYSHYGHVVWLRENVQRTDGNPAAGAVAGAIVGALIGGRGPAALFGAAGGAAVGASVSQGHSESRRYDVMVQFDDGAARIFFYGGHSPFLPGEPVVLTPRGLFHG
jgi:outer membrane lipoprotein SlyB